MSKINAFIINWYIILLRREITQYCRDPPPDFNEHQKSLFCVFSGHGVNQLRNYLNQVVEERTYQGDIHTIFNERRRRFLNGDFDMDDEELNIWERRRMVTPGAAAAGAGAAAGIRGIGAAAATTTGATGGTGTVITPDLTHPDMAEINREIFRELNEGNMGPEEMREHFQRLIRNHHQQRLLESQNRLNQRMAVLPTTTQQQQQQQQQQQNPQNAPQIEQPAVFPNDNTNNNNNINNLPVVLNEDEDIEMEAADLFPRNT